MESGEGGAAAVWFPIFMNPLVTSKEREYTSHGFK